MPIRPDQKGLYPPDWKQISDQRREQAGQKCERCKAPNGQVVARGQAFGRAAYMLERGETYDAETGEFIGMTRGSEFNGSAFVKIVLTVAHLDHDPRNCAPDNLRAWCQRCHLSYDAKHHARNAADTRRKRKAAGDLFE